MTAPQTVARLIAEAAARLELVGERGREGTQQRAPTASLPNARLDAELLFRGVTGWSRADLLARGHEPVGAAVIEGFESAIARRAQHEPVQYILGRAAFWRDEFVVNPAVLIPRPDTEILIERVANHLRSLKAPRLLDLGTGSGCIALSLLRELPSAMATAVDVSEAALDVASENARRLDLASRIEFRLSRWFDAIPAAADLDAIVSNPPYVAQADESSLPAEVRDFEPRLALFAEDTDDLSSYRAIVSAAGTRLTLSGLLAFEVGLGQADRVAELMRASGFTVIEIANDLAQIPRVVIGRKA